MFGALAASPNSAVRGYGVPLAHLTFGMLVFPGVWDWYVEWRERRRGFYTTWEADMLNISLALVVPCSSVSFPFVISTIYRLIFPAPVA